MKKSFGERQGKRRNVSQHHYRFAWWFSPHHYYSCCSGFPWTRLVVHSLLVLVLVTCIPETTTAEIIELPTDVFYNGVMDGFFDVIVDVRSQREFDAGHIPGATLVEQLALFGTSLQVGTPSDLAGCEACHVVVYDRSGGRATVALQLLEQQAGFVHLYQGFGTNQWTLAGYDLETDTPSVIPQCTANPVVCSDATLTPTKSPLPPLFTLAPSIPPVSASPPTTTTRSPTTTDTAAPTWSGPQTFELNLVQFHDIFQAGLLDVIIDVRTKAEFAAGHLPGATLLENLADYGTPGHQGGRPSDLAGCEYCAIALYDSSGQRARVAMEHMAQAGFWYLFNGQGTLQWTAFGYEDLVMDTNSVAPTCVTDEVAGAQCQALHRQQVPPTDAPIEAIFRPPLVTQAPTPTPSALAPAPVEEFIRLTAASLLDLRQRALLDVILDVRDIDFDAAAAGSEHLLGATLMGPLTTQNGRNKLAFLEQCVHCTVVVYASDDNEEASVDALMILRANGFVGTMYHGPTIEAWIAAGYPLVDDPSYVPLCSIHQAVADACLARSDDQVDNGDPSLATTQSPTVLPTHPPLPPEPENENETFAKFDPNTMLELTRMAQLDIIFDVRSDFQGGHLLGATLLGPLNPANAARKLDGLDACIYCTIVVYGNADDDVQVALTTLRQTAGFGGQLYRGPNLEDWLAADLSLVNLPSVWPRCSTDEGIAQRCFEKPRGGSSPLLPTVTPSLAPTVSPVTPRPTVSPPTCPPTVSANHNESDNNIVDDIVNSPSAMPTRSPDATVPPRVVDTNEVTLPPTMSATEPRSYAAIGNSCKTTILLALFLSWTL